MNFSTRYIRPLAMWGGWHLARWNAEWVLALGWSLLLLILWEGIAQSRLLDQRMIPPPSAISGAFWWLLQSGWLATHVLASLSRLLIGFALGAVPALLLGLVFGRDRWVRAFLRPFMSTLYALPAIALMPLFMLHWGVSEQAQWLVIATAVFSPILVHTVMGIGNVSGAYVDTAKTAGASLLQLYRTVLLPASLPQIFRGVTLATWVALSTLVVVELCNTSVGLAPMSLQASFAAGVAAGALPRPPGAAIWWYGPASPLDTLYVGLIVLGALGYAVSWTVSTVERHVLR